MFGTGRNKGESEGQALLDTAVRQWREASTSGETLGPATRAAILRSTRDRGERPTLAALFLPTRRLVWAAGLPALALGLALAALLGVEGLPAPGLREPARIEVSRVGDEVVFQIANGKRLHRVYRSELAADTAAPGQEEAFAVTAGTFRDRLHSGSDLVFYRVD